MRMFSVLFLCLAINYCDSYKILAIFPYNGRSHHIFYSSLVEELAEREHDVTVINYYPVKKLQKLRQILLHDEGNTSDQVNIEEHMKYLSNDILMAHDTAKAFKYIANTNCKKLMINPQIQDLIKFKKSYDVVIVEQFVTDCGLAIAYKLNAPTVGMTAHILMPWTYSRLGASNNPAFVANHFFASGMKPNIFNRIKSSIVNFAMNMYYTHVIQKSDQEIVHQLYPETPSLEDLGKNMSLIMLNQYFPLTGPRLYGPNVIEIGGMHINHHSKELDEDLQLYLDASVTGVIYISFGTVAANFPSKVINEIKSLIEKSNMDFVWKTDITDWKPTSRNNAFLRNWIPQVSVLCHPKVVAFITHSGMLSTSEAMYCGVPIVSVPLFGDQFANGASAVENGLGVVLDITTLDEQVLDKTLQVVLHDIYQKRAKQLSQLWRDRPLPPMNTAIYWVEYVARHKGAVDMKPATVDLVFYQYYMIDLFLAYVSFVVLVFYCICKVLCIFDSKKSNQKVKKRKKN